MPTPSPFPDWLVGAQGAPIEEWLECGDLTDATYVYQKESDLRGWSEGNFNQRQEKVKEKVEGLELGCTLVSLLFTTCAGKERAYAGYVVKKAGDDGTVLYICWRGTLLDEEKQADAMVDLKPGIENWLHGGTPSDFKAHEGFLSLYESAEFHTVDNGKGYKPLLGNLPVPEDFEEVMEARVTGHSLGGALATLCAYDLAQKSKARKVKLVTFCSPRVANVRLAYYMDQVVKSHVRLVTDGDLVPVVPLYTGNQDKQNESAVQGWLQKFMVSIKEQLDKLQNLETWARLLGDQLPRIIKVVLFTRQEPANYHHAGFGVLLSTNGLPLTAHKQVPWTLGNHHNLKLVLCLLTPGDTVRLQAFKHELGLPSALSGGADTQHGEGSNGEESLPKKQKTTAL